VKCAVLFLSSFFFSLSLGQAQSRDSGITYSQNGKPLVSLKCVFRDESVLSCAAMNQFIQDSLDGVEVTPDPKASITIDLRDQAIGDSVEYTLTTSAPSGNFVIRIQIQRTADEKIRKEKLIAPIRDFLGHLMSVPVSTGDTGKAWYFDVTGNARYSNNGKASTSYGGGLYNQNTGSYSRLKIDNVNYFDYSSSSQIYSGSRQSIRGLNAGTSAAITYSLNSGKHWNGFALGSAEHSPAGKNLNFSQSSSVGIEWNLVPIRDQGQPTQVRVQASLGYVYNAYHLRTMFNRLYETYATGGANVVFIIYTNDARLKTTGSLGATVPLRPRGETTGTYTGGINLSYQIRPSKPAIRLETALSVRYRPQSLTDPDPSIPLQSLFYNLYNNSPGFSTYARIGVSVTFGNARKKSQDQRGPHL